jgi:hypothetical protein
MYNPNKPIKLGQRVHVPGDCGTGCISRIVLYIEKAMTGRLIRMDLPLTSRIVLSFCDSDGLLVKMGFICIWTTSVPEVK